MRAETTKLNFTKGMLEKLKAPAAGKTTIYDRQVPGLGVQAMPTGKKIFFWFRDCHGAPTWRTIGNFPDLSLEDARTKAGENNTKLAKWKADEWAGPNPFARSSGALTLEDLMKAYIEQHLREHAKRPEKAEKNVKWMVDKYLAHWKDRPLAEITPERVAALHREIGAKHHRTANSVVKLLRTFFRFADRAHIYSGALPTKGIKFYYEPRRSRYLHEHELPKLGDALDRAENPDLKAYVGLALYTAARKSDILSMRWQDIDEDGHLWVIPNPKSRRPYAVKLTREALAILKERPRIENNPWVFPSHGKTGHVVDLKGAWKKLCGQRGSISRATRS